MWIDVQQNTDEWLNLRVGKMTSSMFKIIMAHEGKDFGKPALKYAEEIAYEIITGKKYEKDNYTNEHMQRGHEYEDEARKAYEYESFNDVTNGGFFDHGWYGDSPDGLIGDNGCLEIKVVVENVQRKNIKRGTVDPAYKWQVVGHILASGAEFCDFFTYCPDIEGEDSKFCYRFRKDQELEDRLLKRMYEFKDVIKQKVDELNLKGIIS